MINKIKELFVKEVWRKPLNEHSPRRMFLIKQIRIFSLALQGFTKDRVGIRASALTYYSLLSIVPIAAMVFGIAKGFGFEKRLELELKDALAGQDAVYEWLLTFVERYLSNIQGGLIAGIGLVVLIWSVMKLLSNIEASFNDIWQIKKSRMISRKLSDYISLVVIAPILVFVSSSATIFLSKQIETSEEVIPLISYLGTFFGIILSYVVPLLLIWLVFTLLYIIMPNTKVDFKSAFIGGIIAGTSFQLLQWGYINFQSLLSGYGRIYGSFAALPLFLMWLQLSWLIVLLGAEVAFSNQNIGHYLAESETYNISYHLKRVVSILLIRKIALNFKNSVPPMTAEELANELNLPIRLIRDILYELLEVGIISETVTKNVKESAYQPARDTNLLTISYITDLLDKRGNDNLSAEITPDQKKILSIFDGLFKEAESSKLNKLITEI